MSSGQGAEGRGQERATRESATSSFCPPPPAPCTLDVLQAILATGNRARFTATGDSMHPFIRSGESLLVERADARDLRRGDVVLALLERGLTAHRIVRIERDRGDVVRIVTRGDNCADDDAPFAPDQLVGRILGYRFRNLVTIIALARHWVRLARR